MTDDLKARGVRVKALEWADFDGFGAKASGFYQANYLIQKWSGEGRYEVAMSYPGYETGYDGPRWHPTIEAAKAAAQADYESRILAALELDPTALSDHPTVKALVAEAVAAERSKMIIAVQRAFEHRRGLMSVAVASDKATAAIRGETT